MSKSRVSLSADSVSKKWNTRMKNAVPDMVNGIQNCQTNPMEAAANNADAWYSRITEAHTSGRWQKRLRSVSFETWKTNTAKKVQERVAGGVDAAMLKRKNFDTWLVNRLNTVLPEVAAMSKKTKEEARAKMNRMFDLMSEQRYKDTI